MLRSLDRPLPPDFPVRIAGFHSAHEEKIQVEAQVRRIFRRGYRWGVFMSFIGLVFGLGLLILLGGLTVHLR